MISKHFQRSQVHQRADLKGYFLVIRCRLAHSLDVNGCRRYVHGWSTQPCLVCVHVGQPTTRRFTSTHSRLKRQPSLITCQYWLTQFGLWSNNVFTCERCLFIIFIFLYNDQIWIFIFIRILIYLFPLISSCARTILIHTPPCEIPMFYLSLFRNIFSRLIEYIISAGPTL